jgi:hypothetical protein
MVFAFFQMNFIGTDFFLKDFRIRRRLTAAGNMNPAGIAIQQTPIPCGSLRWLAIRIFSPVAYVQVISYDIGTS